MQVVDDIVARGAKPENIRIVAIVCAPPAMVKLSQKYKGACVKKAGRANSWDRACVGYEVEVLALIHFFG